MSARPPRRMDPTWWVRQRAGVYTQQGGFGRIFRHDDGLWDLMIGGACHGQFRLLQDAKDEAWAMTAYLEGS